MDNLYREKTTQNKQLKETLEALSLFRVHFSCFVQISFHIGAISTHWRNINSIVQYKLNREISTQLVQYQLDVSISRHSFCAKWQLGVQTFYHLPTKPLMFYFHKRKEKGKCLEKSPILDSFGDLVDPFNYKFS